MSCQTVTINSGGYNSTDSTEKIFLYLLRCSPVQRECNLLQCPYQNHTCTCSSSSLLLFLPPGCQSSPQWQRCSFQISPLPPLIKAAVGETHLYSWWETMLPLPPKDWFSPLKRALCLKTLHPLCYAKEKMEDFQFNLGWVEGRSAIWASIVLAEPAGTSLASPKRQLSRTERQTGG